MVIIDEGNTRVQRLTFSLEVLSSNPNEMVAN